MNSSNWEREILSARGKVLALLLHRGVDIVTAEDAVSTAVLKALKQWPEAAPANPEAWLMTVSWRRALDARRNANRTSSLHELTAEPQTDPEAMLGLIDHLPDERLRLYFLCTHPALDQSVQCPLMLQLVTGMTVEQIADLFLLPTPSMAQRLVRAKRKIRDAGIQPRLPDAGEVPKRVIPVLDALYGLYFAEWRGQDGPRQAQELSEILADLLPNHPETHGLAALICFCESRRYARQGPNGEYIPLDEQDRDHWIPTEIDRAETYLQRAAKLESPGRYQLEAAIQSAHVQRLKQGSPSWSTIVRLYDRLLLLAPTAGFAIGRIAALMKAEGALVALAQLDEFRHQNPELAENFHPYLVTRAHCLWQLGRETEAKEVAQTALRTTVNDAEKAFLSTCFQLAAG
jgi:RNA polymerase sigma-70 factor (ECF subfamily)